jgi:hypothetical protein
MSKDIFKEDYINYLVDVKGYSEEDAQEAVAEHGVRCIEREDLKEFYAFIN